MRLSTARIAMPALAEPMLMTLSAYRILTAAGTALAPRVLERRLARGKENPDRIAERRGEASAPRPPGPLLWVPGALAPPPPPAIRSKSENPTPEPHPPLNPPF